jgi:hypothetical protein
MSTPLTFEALRSGTYGRSEIAPQPRPDAAGPSSSPPPTAALSPAAVAPSATAEGPPADQDPRYDETTRWALGVAKQARDDVESLEQNVAQYNSAKASLEDPAQLEAVRAKVGDERLRFHVAFMQRMLESSGRNVQDLTAKISRTYQVSGTPTARDAGGYLQLNAYTLTTGGPGWTSSVSSSGVARVVAGGADVSAQVDNRKMAGGVWSPRAPGQSYELQA